MADKVSNAAYFELRSLEEASLALKSTDLCAAAVHRRLSARYAQQAGLLAGGPKNNVPLFDGPLVKVETSNVESMIIVRPR